LTTDSLAFAVFVAVFCGGLVVMTFVMLWIAVALYRRNRHRFPHPARVLRFVRRTAQKS
jgi:TRAP-type C4-dicarboxylate transport system permease large subunit